MALLAPLISLNVEMLPRRPRCGDGLGDSLLCESAEASSRRLIRAAREGDGLRVTAVVERVVVLLLVLDEDEDVAARAEEVVGLGSTRRPRWGDSGITLRG